MGAQRRVRSSIWDTRAASQRERDEWIDSRIERSSSARKGDKTTGPAEGWVGAAGGRGDFVSFRRRLRSSMPRRMRSDIKRGLHPFLQTLEKYNSRPLLSLNLGPQPGNPKLEGMSRSGTVAARRPAPGAGRCASLVST